MITLFNVVDVSVPMGVFAPPVALIRRGEFPDCGEVFRELLGGGRQAEARSGQFVTLCRVTGFAWLVWAWNTLLELFLFLFGLAAWASREMITTTSVAGLPFKQAVSVAATLLVLSLGFYYGICLGSLQLRDHCVPPKRQPVSGGGGRRNAGRTPGRRTRKP